MIYSSADNSENEIAERKKRLDKIMQFGVSFLDDALVGIAPSDLVLVGAGSGAGKTQFCVNVAKKNIEAGKRVAYFALEADLFEIEARIKYQMLAQEFFDPTSPMRRPSLSERLAYDKWYLGKYFPLLDEYEELISTRYRTTYHDLFLFYKQADFGINEFIQGVIIASQKSDLIIVDHVHYFDLDDDNENRAMKEIAKTARTLSLEQNKPIILVSHLRKRDRGNLDLAPGLDEFHGSSDLFKIATKVITIAPGGMTSDGLYETFFRIPKNRWSGSSSRFLGQCLFSPQKGTYEKEYKIGWANQQRANGFEQLERSFYPEWAAYENANTGGDNSNHVQATPTTTKQPYRKSPYERSYSARFGD